MTITKVLKVLAIVLMAIAFLVAASWASSLWAAGVSFLGRLLPDGNEPIAAGLRGWLPTVSSVGTIIVLIVAALMGWTYGRKIWFAWPAPKKSRP